ncbi:MAG: hypothetical protein WD602_02575 [Actinomycetota bacterium]
MRVVAQLDMDIRAPEDPLRGPELGGLVERLDCYRMCDVDLRLYAGLVITGTVDQEFLAGNRQIIHEYLDSGGVVVFGGHLHRDWLPGSSPFVPLEGAKLRDYQVVEVADHPVFAGVDPADLTFRRGVAGFFARGHHPPPEGAQVLTRLFNGRPSTYLDQVSTPGTILVQSTCDLLGYATGLKSSASRIPRQLVRWILNQSEEVRRRGPVAAGTVAGHSPRWPEPPKPASGYGVAAVYGGSAAHYRALTKDKYAERLDGGLIYLPELADADLTPYEVLLIPERLHRGLLEKAAPRIFELLDAGGTVVCFAGGEPIPEFLPGVRWEHVPTNYWWWLDKDSSLGLRSPSPSHSLFDYLQLADCTWHYHGVLDPPPGAEVLVTLPGGEALLYVDRNSTAGTLVVSTLDPLSHYGSYFMPATERFLDGFLPWLTHSFSRTTSSGPPTVQAPGPAG